MKIIYSPECLRYGQKGHPESPERVKSSYNFLKEEGYKFLRPEFVIEQDLLEVHSKELVEKVKSGNFFNFDSPAYENIFYYASLSAGASILAMNECLKKKEHCFSLMRPPGHHASKDNLGGFCYFNNVAIAVAKAIRDEKVKKVTILDIDVHHGNGTQDIFLNNKKVVYISLHQFPHYPGTGLKSEKNCFNYPLSAGTKEKTYLEKLKKALRIVKKFNPDLIAVSAGFDTYKKDPLSSLELEFESYEKIGKMIKALEKPTFSVLEGGYTLDLGRCIYFYLKGFE